MSSFQSPTRISRLARLVLLSVLMFAGIANANDKTTENADKNDLSFRGQGRNPWCYAFAEEQLIKDALCSGAECDGNAASLKYSIIDITVAAAKHDEEKNLSTTTASPLPLDQDLFNGSSDFFSIGQGPNPSIALAECTLENDLFLWNRSPDFNPRKLNLGQQLNEFWLTRKVYGAWRNRASGLQERMQILESNKTLRPSEIKRFNNAFQVSIDKFNQEKLELEATGLASLMDQLDQIANVEDSRSASGQNNFVDSVLKFRRCDNRVSLANLIPHHVLLSQPKEIQAKIEGLMGLNKSVEVGVCAEVLENEKMGKINSCGGHAIVVKKIRSTTAGTELMVVDSAFFSSRPRNSDGTIWVPEVVVVMAAQKYAQYLAQILAKFEREQQNTVSKNLAEINQLKTHLEKEIDGTISEVRKALKKSIREKGDITDLVVSMLKEWPNSSIYNALIDKIALSHIRSTTDLENFLSDFRAVQLDAVSAQLSNGLGGAKTDLELNASNLDWFDERLAKVPLAQ